jgi:hypothetical protein
MIRSCVVATQNKWLRKSLPNGERRMSEDCPYRTLSRRCPCHYTIANRGLAVEIFSSR